ncbi:hypothetical protein KMW28_24265 [Flammeovirga yaeyamensis]|uniref:Lipoprotein n=1 Tax=Flammeovirga yaeyamensis TaxID=367791 RepID=A0AAX1NFR8_9BACT|nr:hypothetical protein [Flammeovirga yaeyamensis]MBB3696502.1 hypothetical protein [Flammeovirga yaeyamensis]NMF33182.1 hypothetical protein [Flammeovirga yaeyamensis]QWG05538.1 hypothetical protein KMW28_24265 [Flammeovirga yaeyamensis]
MKKSIQLTIFISIILTLSSCFPEGFTEQANQKFGDQHFKTAISLIELHHIREGEYPESLKSLKYTGDWDVMIYQSVKYKKLEEGYQLDLVNGWVGKPNNLSYPDEFWKGLGLVKSNLKK